MGLVVAMPTAVRRVQVHEDVRVVLCKQGQQRLRLGGLGFDEVAIEIEVLTVPSLTNEFWTVLLGAVGADLFVARTNRIDWHVERE